jgi:predicted transcriptional regulator
VGEAGLGFDDPEELPERLDRLVAELDRRRAAIRVPSLADVADRYLETLGLA